MAWNASFGSAADWANRSAVYGRSQTTPPPIFPSAPTSRGGQRFRSSGTFPPLTEPATDVLLKLAKRGHDCLLWSIWHHDDKRSGHQLGGAYADLFGQDLYNDAMAHNAILFFETILGDQGHEGLVHRPGFEALVVWLRAKAQADHNVSESLASDTFRFDFGLPYDYIHSSNGVNREVRNFCAHRWTKPRNQSTPDMMLLLNLLVERKYPVWLAELNYMIKELERKARRHSEPRRREARERQQTERRLSDALLDEPQRLRRMAWDVPTPPEHENVDWNYTAPE